MLTGREEAVEPSLHKTSPSAMLAGLMASMHAVPEHFDVACSPASAELQGYLLFGVLLAQYRQDGQLHC
jgi:hypothetical protein